GWPSTRPACFPDPVAPVWCGGAPVNFVALQGIIDDSARPGRAAALKAATEENWQPCPWAFCWHIDTPGGTIFSRFGSQEVWEGPSFGLAVAAAVYGVLTEKPPDPSCALAAKITPSGDLDRV